MLRRVALVACAALLGPALVEAKDWQSEIERLGLGNLLKDVLGEDALKPGYTGEEPIVYEEPEHHEEHGEDHEEDKEDYDIEDQIRLNEEADHHEVEEEEPYQVEVEQEDQHEEERPPMIPATPIPVEVLHLIHIKIDVNRNGKVSVGELMNFHDKIRKHRAMKSIARAINHTDTDKDGKLSKAEVLDEEEEEEEVDPGDTRTEAEKLDEKMWHKEYMAEEQLKFAAADLNHDGFLQGDEVSAFYYPDTHPGVLEAMTRIKMKRSDVNNDGKLTVKEFWEEGRPGREDDEPSEGEEADFNKLDINQDGFLDLEELKAYESGRSRALDNFEQLLNISDTDGDKHVTSKELESKRHELVGTDANQQLEDWAHDHDEL